MPDDNSVTNSEPEVRIRRKITLRRKMEEAAFTFDGRLKVVLYWTSDTDLDLCLFFRKKDGGFGGVFAVGVVQVFCHPSLVADFDGLVNLSITAVFEFTITYIWI